MGGIGKSQLALAYAHRHRGEYELVRWLPSEEPASLTAAYMALAPALGLPADAPDQAALIAALRDQLESRGRFLLVFDNAPGPRDLRPYLPRGGRGHVLITSRERHWQGTAQPLELDLLPEADAIELLTGRTAEAGTRAEAKALAEELGFLPLALAQARAYVDELAVDLPTYRRRLAESGRKVRARGLPEDADYPHSVATVWQASIEAAERRCPAARPLLELLAFLAPDAVPRGLFDAEPGLLPEALREPAEHEEAAGALARFSLLRADPTTLSVHRLVQAVTRDELDEATAKARAETAIRLVNAALPRPPWEHTNWPAIAAMLAHALAAAESAQRLEAGLETAATVLNETALYHKSRAAWAEAEPLYQRAIAIGEKTLGPEHPDLATWLNNLALLYQDTGRYAEAEPLLQRAMAIGEKTLGPEHPALAIRLNNLATLYQATGRDAEAEPLYERAIAIDEKTLGPEHPELATRLNNLALLYRDTGRDAEAEPLYERAIAIDKKALGPEHPGLATYLNNLALLYQDTGRYAEAEPLFQRAVAIGEKALPPNHPNLRMARYNYAGLLDKLSRTNEAAVLRSRADAASR
jgi:tetratricopeptide (TPR) repeat protein